MLPVFLLVLLTLVALLALLGAIGTATMRRGFTRERDALLRHAREAVRGEVAPAPLETLPAPVRRYLEVAGTGAGSRLVTALLVQRGALRAGVDQPWVQFESEQACAMEPPGFVWLARASAAPGVGILAQDQYVHGRGRMRVRALGLLSIANASGPEIDQGAGLRYWSEVLAFPESTMSPRLRWQPIDVRHARFTVVGASPALSAEVEFDATGLPCATRAGRYRDVRGARAHAVVRAVPRVAENRRSPFPGSLGIGVAPGTWRLQRGAHGDPLSPHRITSRPVGSTVLARRHPLGLARDDAQQLEPNDEDPGREL